MSANQNDLAYFQGGTLWAYAGVGTTGLDHFTGGALFRAGFNPTVFPTVALSAAGGVAFGGAAAMSRTANLAAAGGVTFGGAAALSMTANLSASGGLVFGGVYHPAGDTIVVLASAGGVVFGGSALFAVLPPQIGPFSTTARRIGPDPRFSRSRRIVR